VYLQVKSDLLFFHRLFIRNQSYFKECLWNFVSQGFLKLKVQNFVMWVEYFYKAPDHFYELAYFQSYCLI